MWKMIKIQPSSALPTFAFQDRQTSPTVATKQPSWKVYFLSIFWSPNISLDVCKQTVSGWWLGHPSEKYDFVNWDDYSQLNGKIKNGNQTTNQIWTISTDHLEFLCNPSKNMFRQTWMVFCEKSDAFKVKHQGLQGLPCFGKLVAVAAA